MTRNRNFGVLLAALAAGGSGATAFADIGAGAAWITPGAGKPLPASAQYENDNGKLGIVNADGAITTRGHAFFEPLGAAGRACVTCHQPANGMSVSAVSLRERWTATAGKDPVFAAFDGSNCPELPQDKRESHSLILDRGLFRIALPWPPKPFDGVPVKPEFTIEVVEDPTTCNTSAKWGLKSADPHVSVYRRPRPVANLKYPTTPYAEFYNIKTGTPLPVDPETGKRVSLNLMSDARSLTLREQAQQASVDHLGMKPDELTKAQSDQILAFERQVYAAQQFDKRAGALDTPDSPPGLGPVAMQTGKFGLGNILSRPVFLTFEPWKDADRKMPGDANAAFRASVARGADIFLVRPFWITDAVHINTVGLGNPLKRSCATCHGGWMTGMDVAPGWIDLGTTNLPTANPQPDLPTFKITCNKDAEPHPYLGRTVYTHDPGRALISGKCNDIGSITNQQMRGLSARAPYFSNGSASNLREVIDYYDRRFQIHYSQQEKADLENFLSVL